MTDLSMHHLKQPPPLVPLVQLGQLGIRANWRQFSLLVLVNALVGAMIGLERSILPIMAEQKFHLNSYTAMLGFIVIFGVSKALSNYFAGHFCDRYGRKVILVTGWLIAIPVPLLLIGAHSWGTILIANIFLGISQGLCWSSTVIMKIDLAGAKNRGLAMGINEFAGYCAVGITAFVTAYLGENFGLQGKIFYLAPVFLTLGLMLSLVWVRDTQSFTKLETQSLANLADPRPRPAALFWHTSWQDKNLASIVQVGLVNNLNDGMAWGLFPIGFAAAGMSYTQIGLLMAAYPTVWGMMQLFTGGLSDRIGRKILIVGGMGVQALGITLIALSKNFNIDLIASLLMGLGTAMVYPTLLAAIGDFVHPTWRASSVGIYRLWRDLGYAIGALLSGFTADYFGFNTALLVVAALTLLSGLACALRLQESVHDRTPA